MSWRIVRGLCSFEQMPFGYSYGLPEGSAHDFPSPLVVRRTVL